MLDLKIKHSKTKEIWEWFHYHDYTQCIESTLYLSFSKILFNLKHLLSKIRACQSLHSCISFIVLLSVLNCIIYFHTHITLLKTVDAVLKGMLSINTEPPKLILQWVRVIHLKTLSMKYLKQQEISVKCLTYLLAYIKFQPLSFFTIKHEHLGVYI